MRALTAAFVLVSLSTGCKSDDPTKAEYWVDRLNKRAERAEALRQLGKIGDKAAIPDVVKWLKEDGEWQSEAAYALGQLGDPSVVPELLAQLDPNATRDSFHKNRRNIQIARALALLKAKEGTAPLRGLLKKASDDRVRETAAQAIAEIGGPDALAVISEAALEDDSALVRLSAVQAMGTLGDAKAVPTLVRMLYVEQQNASFYAPARYALVQIGPAAVPELVRTLERKNPEVEAMKLPDGKPIPDGFIEAKAASTLGALRAVEAMGIVTSTLTKLYAQAKKAGPKSTVYAAVIELAYAVGNLGGPAATAVLLPLAKDPDANLRLAGCESLITVGDRGVAPQLIAAAKVGDTAARRAALVAASRLGSATELQAFEALASSGDKKTPNELMAEMVEGEKVRLLAAKECQRNAGCWKGKLADQNPKVRERAGYELGWLEAKEAVPDLVKLAEDGDAEARMAAVLSLHRLGGADPQRLQAIYDQWQSKLEYAPVNQELLQLIARAKSKNGKK